MSSYSPKLQSSSTKRRVSNSSSVRTNAWTDASLWKVKTSLPAAGVCQAGKEARIMVACVMDKRGDSHFHIRLVLGLSAGITNKVNSCISGTCPPRLEWDWLVILCRPLTETAVTFSPSHAGCSVRSESLYPIINILSHSLPLGLFGSRWPWNDC